MIKEVLKRERMYYQTLGCIQINKSVGNVITKGKIKHVCAMCAKLLQFCLTLRDPIDGGPPGPSVHGIRQVRTLEWVAIFPSRGSSQPRDLT